VPLPAAAGADCDLETTVQPSGAADVKYYLSEMSAELAEFHVLFRHTQISPGKVSAFTMEKAEPEIIMRRGESILGILKALRCTCVCDTVTAFTEKVFGDVSKSWTDEEKGVVQKALTDFIPSFWPKSLQKK
jgi:hypothetical protein